MLHLRRRARLTAAALVGLIGVFAAPGLAVAAPGDPVVVVISPSTRTIEYGQYWEAVAKLTNSECVIEGCDRDFDLIVESPINGEVITTPLIDDSVFISGFDLPSLNPLPPGTYEIRGQMSSEEFTMADDNQPASLIVTAAALDVETTVIADDHQPTGAIVSAQLSGDYVNAIDECFGSTECHPQLPSGTWKLQIHDSSGATVHEETIATKGTASRYVSYYWHGIAPASEYTVDATFAPASDSAANFDVSGSEGTTYTSPEAPDAGDPDAPVAPDVEVEVAASPTLPLWLVIVLLTLAGGLAVTSVVFWLLLRRRQAAASTDPEAAPAEEYRA